MNERIRGLCELCLCGKTYAYPTKTTFDDADLSLSREVRESKRIAEYILNQTPVLTEFSTMTGFFKFDGSVVGDAFTRSGHEATQRAMSLFYLKRIDNLSTMEWQHATADYAKVLKKGIRGIIEDIDASLKVHEKEEEIAFLLALRHVAEAMISWAHKCSTEALRFAQTVEREEYRENLKRLSQALLRIPEQPPQTFYEAVLAIYVCFSADPDSVGTLDRYLYPFYKRDRERGILSREEAASYLQELFLMLQSATYYKDSRFTRGGESHFCIGGYLPNGEDGYNEMSELILESLVDLPTWIPQLTFRWTRKTPREVFRHVLDTERRDPNKRIAFQNDEKRIKCYTEICKIPYETAVGYTTVGCNEPAFLGAITGSNSKVNFLHAMETVFHKKADLIENAPSFDAFFKVFLTELCSDLTEAYRYDDFYNTQRAADINYISSLFFNDCIENATSLTQGGGNTVIASPMCLGITNVIDSLCVVKQFVYDEGLIPLKELIDALKADWVGYEDLRTLILKKGKFFGNDDDTSNTVARALYQSLYEFLREKTNVFGYHWLIGDLVGYHSHHKWFGEHTKATPDGRRSGDALKFGLYQSEGRDREGLTALLHAIATVDPNGIGCGSTVTNLTIDESLIMNDENFEKTVDLLLTYFENGGVHFQLTYVSREDLICAKATPDDYKHLRVRVSGFSDYFVRLTDPLQDEIIARTQQK